MCDECEKIMSESRAWYDDLTALLKNREENEKLILKTLGVELPDNDKSNT